MHCKPFLLFFSGGALYRAFVLILCIDLMHCHILLVEILITYNWNWDISRCLCVCVCLVSLVSFVPLFCIRLDILPSLFNKKQSHCRLSVTTPFEIALVSNKYKCVQTQLTFERTNNFFKWRQFSLLQSSAPLSRHSFNFFLIFSGSRHFFHTHKNYDSNSTFLKNTKKSKQFFSC